MGKTNMRCRSCAARLQDLKRSKALAFESLAAQGQRW